MNIIKITVAVVATGTLTACSVEGTRQLNGPNDYIAIAVDRGRDAGSNVTDNAGIAVTPDGCQAWVIDDGVEGRASNRLDPVSGLPVCAGQPGVVYGPYQSGDPGIADRVPGDPVNVVIQQVEVLPTTGHAHEVHPVSQPHH